MNKFKWKDETGPISYTLIKINSNWIKDLNAILENMKLFEENSKKNIGTKHTDMSFVNNILKWYKKHRKQIQK